jgi:hypothetical protein
MSADAAHPNVHPIVEDILAALQDGGPGQEPAELPAAAARALAQKIDGFLATPELFDVVETVLYASHLLETEVGAPGAAKAVLALVERRTVLDAMKRLNVKRSAERADAVGARGRAFARFAGRAPDRPATPTPAPKGSVPLALAFPRRM